MTLLRNRRATAALEFAICFPAVLLFIFAFFSAYTLIATKRAMDYGIEKALRYAAVNGGATTAAIENAYNTAAALIWPEAGIISAISISPANAKAGQTVTISVTYAWSAPAGLRAPDASTIFTPITLSASGSMMVVN